MKLYVGNLPFSMDEAQVRTLFESHGAVDSVSIITDRETGRPRGFGFVEMADDQSCRNAMKALDNHMVDGRNLKVNEAKPRANGGRDGGSSRW